TREVINFNRVRLESVNGNIELYSVSGSDSIIIAGEKRVGSESVEDAEAHLSEIEVTIQQLAHELYVKSVQPQVTFGRSYQIDYTIFLPDNLEVVVKNINGNILLDTINNNVSIVNTNGNIDGSVLLALGGTITIDNNNGNIDLEIPQNSSALIALDVTNGTITVDNLDLQNVESSPTYFYAMLGAGSGVISLSTVNGNIVMTGF
ncbi:DUF4097 family beta strand repeat-containing protein, partial [candidate division KSB1 bacterium]